MGGRTEAIGAPQTRWRRSVVALKVRGHSWGIGVNLWSLADQGAISGGTFLTSLVLARTLRPAEFGVYALLLGIVLFLNTIQSSLVLYPLSVAGAKADPDLLRRLASSSLLITAFCWLPLGALLLGASFAVGRPGAAPWAFLALLGTQLQLTIRGAFASQLRLREVLLGDCVSYLGQAGVVWLLVRGGVSSVEPVFAAMAATSVVAGVLQAAKLGLTSNSWTATRALGSDYWRLGRWTVLSSMIGLVTVQAPPWALALFHGPREVAALLVVANILGATHPVMFSVGNLVVPAVARARLQGGVSAARRTAIRYGAQGGVLVLPYYLGLLAAPGLALVVFYGRDSPYRGLETEVRIMAMGYLLIYARIPLESFLRGLEQSRSAMLITVVNAVGIAAFVAPLASARGVLGATGGITLAALVALIASVVFARRTA